MHQDNVVDLDLDHPSDHRKILFHVGRNDTAYYTIHHHYIWREKDDDSEPALIHYDARFPPEWARDGTVVSCRSCQMNQSRQGLWIGYCAACACMKYFYTRGYGFSQGIERTWKEAYEYAKRNLVTEIKREDEKRLKMKKDCFLLLYYIYP
jgi:hypothetical protein